MADEPAIALPSGPFQFCIESPLSQDTAAIRIEALRRRPLLRGVSPRVKTYVGGGGYRVSADVGRNLWIHMEGTIDPIPNGTVVTGELSKGLGWGLFVFGAALFAVVGAVGVVVSMWAGAGNDVLPSLVMLVCAPAALVVAYLRVTRTQRSIIRKLTAAVEGTLHVSSELDRNSHPR